MRELSWKRQSLTGFPEQNLVGLGTGSFLRRSALTEFFAPRELRVQEP
jgi:hypothetical protein